MRGTIPPQKCTEAVGWPTDRWQTSQTPRKGSTVETISALCRHSLVIRRGDEEESYYSLSLSRSILIYFFPVDTSDVEWLRMADGVPWVRSGVSFISFIVLQQQSIYR